MSIDKREEKNRETGFYQKQRRADRARERYQTNTIANLIKQAEFKSSMGMDLTDSERFVIDNKSFLLRKKGKPMEQ